MEWVFFFPSGGSNCIFIATPHGTSCKLGAKKRIMVRKVIDSSKRTQKTHYPSKTVN